MKADRQGEVDAIDLSPLDPTGRPDFDAKVGRVVAMARPELARRRAAARAVVDPFGSMPRLWGRVVWPAAAAVALMSLVFLRTGEASAMGATADEEMAIAVGVPEVLAPWIDETEAPGLGAILVGWEAESER